MGANTHRMEASARDFVVAIHIYQHLKLVYACIPYPFMHLKLGAVIYIQHKCLFCSMDRPK